MISFLRTLRVGVSSFFVLLNTLSYSVDMAGIERVSKAVRRWVLAFRKEDAELLVLLFRKEKRRFI
jgi:hypothetical protein